MLNSKTWARHLSLTGIGIALLITMSPVHAKVYKWTDADGQVHYSQTPPPKSLGAPRETKVMKDLSRKYFPRKKDGETYCAGEKLYNITSYNVELKVLYLINEKHRIELLASKERDTEEHDILRCKVQFYKAELRQRSNRIEQIRNEYESLERRRQALAESKRTNCHSDSTLLIGDKARDIAECLDRHESLDDIKSRLRELKTVYFAITEKLDG